MFGYVNAYLFIPPRIPWCSLEALHALMFPLEWICCYIPLLPTTKQFLDILQSPVPFMIGIPHSQSLSQKVRPP